MYAAFATGSLTWHEAAKSNNAAEAKEAALKEDDITTPYLVAQLEDD
jgi:hypothetical protein